MFSFDVGKCYEFNSRITVYAQAVLSVKYLFNCIAVFGSGDFVCPNI